MIYKLEYKRMATRGSREPVQTLRCPEHRRDLGQQILSIHISSLTKEEVKETVENIFDPNKKKIPFPLLNPPQKPQGDGPLSFLKWLFSLSEDERIRAGIYTGEEKRELMAASALRIPPPEYDQPSG